jgi:hypothetical protein
VTLSYVYYWGRVIKRVGINYVIFHASFVEFISPCRQGINDTARTVLKHVQIRAIIRERTKLQKSHLITNVLVMAILQQLSLAV